MPTENERGDFFQHVDKLRCWGGQECEGVTEDGVQKRGKLVCLFRNLDGCRFASLMDEEERAWPVLEESLCRVRS